MFVLFPYGTDAAIGHRPYATVALIAANLAIGLLVGFAGESSAIDAWALQGGRFTPWTWITVSFLHAGWVHLLANMLFLWPFGLIVEGYAGPRRFLAAYFAISFVGAGVAQVTMLGSPGVTAVGASLAISGVMAMAALWAPRNRLDVWLWIVTILRRVRPTVWGYCLLWVVFDVLRLLLFGIVSAGAAHLMGTAAGAGAGVLYLRKGWVKCDGWDWFSLREHGRPRSQATVGQVQDHPLTRLRAALDRGDASSADEIVTNAKELHDGDALTREDHLRLVSGLAASPARSDRAIERLTAFVKRYPDGAEEIRLVLARTLLETDHPRQALRELEALEDDALTDLQRARRDVLAAEARNQRPPTSGLELE